MAVFYIGSYDIVDPDEFAKYPAMVLALLPKYGGEVLASDTAGVLVEGTSRTMNAIIRFPSKEAAFGLYNAALGIGTLAASLLFGLIWTRVSPQAAFLTGASLAVAASALLYLLTPPGTQHTS